MRYIILLSFILLLNLSSVCAAGQVASPDLKDFWALESFLDDFMTRKMAEHHIPGAAIVFVKDGEAIFSRGYGYADLEKEIAVDPAATIFRIASVSKLFTFTAVLQLAERGMLDLDEDVNLYLPDWQVFSPYPEPVRVRHLLTHTDGFETRDLSTFELNPSRLEPLGKILAADLKSPVQVPGSVVTYGAYGSALAGYLVEQVSGIPFDEYIDHFIFRELQMDQSTFNQATARELPGLARTYTYNESTGKFEAQPFLTVITAPTGGCSVTAADMSRFMAALLGTANGRGSAVLSENTVRGMLKRQYSPHPQLPGVTYGFKEYFYNGKQGLYRDGSGVGVRAQVFLLPEEQAGYFYVQNTRGDELIEELNAAFLENYFPVEGEFTPPGESSPDHLKRFVGVYAPAQTARHTLIRLEALVSGEIRVKALDDGSLLLETAGMGDFYRALENGTRWVQTEPMLFRRVDREQYIAFGDDEQGRVAYLFSGMGYHGSYQRLPWYAASTVQYSLIGFCLLVFLFAPGTAYLLHRGRAKDGKASTMERLACLLMAPVCILNVSGFAAVIYTLFIRRIADFPACAFGVSAAGTVSLAVLLCGAVSGLGLVVVLITGFLRKEFGVRWSIYSGILTAAILIFTWWLCYWNLLGFHY